MKDNSNFTCSKCNKEIVRYETFYLKSKIINGNITYILDDDGVYIPTCEKCSDLELENKEKENEN